MQEKHPASKLVHLAKRAGKLLLDVIYPLGVDCAACGSPSHGQLLCRDCAEGLERLAIHGPVHTRRRAAWSAYRYDSVSAALVHRLKFSAHSACAQVLADGMARAASSMTLGKDAVVTWVPMPPGRRKQRGIDHAGELARHLAEKLDLPCRPLLKCTRERHTQLGLSAEERQQNVRQAFACAAHAPGQVLLVDDVLTTGATTEACAACLEEGGAEQVFILTATCRAGSADEQEG